VHRARDADVAFVVVAFRQIESPVHEPDWQVELVAVRQSERRAGFGGNAGAPAIGERPQPVTPATQGSGAERAIASPDAVVEGAACGGDCGLDVRRVRIRGPAYFAAGRGADIGVRPSTRRGSQLA